MFLVLAATGRLHVHMNTFDMGAFQNKVSQIRRLLGMHRYVVYRSHAPVSRCFFGRRYTAIL